MKSNHSDVRILHLTLVGVHVVHKLQLYTVVHSSKFTIKVLYFQILPQKYIWWRNK